MRPLGRRFLFALPLVAPMVVVAAFSAPAISTCGIDVQRDVIVVSAMAVRT